MSLSIRIQFIFLLIICCIPNFLWCQEPWIIEAQKINPDKYTGITVSNGVIGVVSSPEPLKAGNVILAGVYDQYVRGRTSNFLSGFNLLNINLSINKQDIHLYNIDHYKQQLNMKNATFTGVFDYKDIATIEYSYFAVLNMLNNVVLNVTVKAKKNLVFEAENTLKLPPGFKEGKELFSEITAPHAKIPLLSTVAKSPTGAVSAAASTGLNFLKNRKIYIK